MKTWNTPSVEEMEVKATAYDPAGGNKEDGVYISYDQKYTQYTYGPSSGNGGTPSTKVD